MSTSLDLFRLEGRVAAVVGGGGVLGGAIARGLAEAGALVAVCDVQREQAEAVAGALNGARAYEVNALAPASLAAAAAAIERDLGPVSILVSAVGGNVKDATTSPHLSFFDIPMTAMEKVIALNLLGGAVLPCQEFGRRMKDLPDGGSIITISSMNALRPLTRIPGYSAAKAALSNFTQWLAVHLAQEYNKRLRVNAIAPGFFLTEQNRFLLTDEQTGALTARGQQIIQHTPMGAFGEPEDLIGAAVWLASPASRFVTGIVLPVDGGFSAYSGV